MDGDAYLAVRDRFIPLACTSDAERPIPACPAWTVRDLTAHLTGLCEDWVEGRLDGYASEAWTAAQVKRFRNCSVDETIHRWDDSAKRLIRLEDDPVMGPPTRWAFGDAIIHEADLRGAVGAERVPDDAVLLALKGSIGRWRESLRLVDAPSLHVQTLDARDWWLGNPADTAAVSVRTSAYELFRALAGRRSEAQIRAWDWSGDPDPYLKSGLPYPFRWSTERLED